MQGAPGPQGPAGPPSRWVLRDANGVDLGEIVPWSGTDAWEVWDGMTMRTYNEWGLSAFPGVSAALFTTTDCTGTSYVASEMGVSAGPQVIVAADSSSGDGFSFYNGVVSAVPEPLTSRSIVGIGFDGCQPYEFTGPFQKMTLDAKVERPAMPLTPAVQP